MRRDLTSGLIAIALMTIVLGLLYPLLVTGAAQLAFPGRANGSLVTRGGRVIGSRLIAQDFRGQARYFQERPSTAISYNASSSSFTNLGPNSRTARDTFRSNLAGYLRLERVYDPGLTAAAVPIDAVTSSASGLDPQISPANAAIQAHRVAAVRRLSLALVNRVVAEHTDRRFLALLGEPGVNVLELNLALDGLRR